MSLVFIDISLSINTTMFTLDRMTLFFFSLSQSYQAKEASDASDDDSGVLADWRRTTHHFTSKSSSASTPTLTSDTSSRPRARSSRAPPSTTGRSALSNPWTKVNGDEIVEDSEPEAIVSDRDETQGSEHIAAISTPPKGKGNRPVSKVTYIDYLLLNSLTFPVRPFLQYMDPRSQPHDLLHVVPPVTQ